MGFTPDISQKVREKMQALGLGSGSGGTPASSTASAGRLGSGSGAAASGSSNSSDYSSSMWNLGKKRIAVAADNQDAANITSYAKSESVKQLIHIAIKDNMLFSGLPPAGLAAIIDSMQPQMVMAGKDIIKQGATDAHEFFVLEIGTCDVFVARPGDITPKKVKTYGPGSAFGELALLYAAPRAATVTTTSPCKVWIAERRVVGTIKRHFAEKAAAVKIDLLEKVPMFGVITDAHKQLLAGALEQVNYAAGDPVWSEKEGGDLFYIIKEGAALLKDAASGAVLSKLGPGAHFGQQSLLGPGSSMTLSSCGGSSSSSATGPGQAVVADGPLTCCVMRRADFERLLGPYDELWRYEALRKVPILFPLSDRQLWQLARVLVRRNFAKGESVFSQGDVADKFYICEKGAFSCFTNDSKELARVGPGQCFGELALMSGDLRAANVMALDNSVALTLDREAFHSLLGRLDSLRSMWRFEALQRVPLLARLDHKTKAAVAAALGQVAMPKGTAVVTQGERGHAFYIVESGQLSAFKDNQPLPVMSYGPGDYFGELALLPGGNTRAATVRARSDVSLLVLDRANFESLLGPLLPQLEAAAKNYAGYRPNKQGVQDLVISECQHVATLGAGGFGRVTLVRYRGGSYALKQMAKGHIVDNKLVAHVHREKKAMLECSSPWLVNLVATAQDDKNIYMLLEVVMGGELFAYLQAIMGGELFAYLQTRRAPLPEPHARFYVASVVLALEYLHGRHLVYRDLKPENLLIGEDGYVKMADFGFVKKVLPGQRTSTLCGTPEYLAPELIVGEGHWQAADWWSLGVLAFELVAGAPPFMHEDRMVMYRRIVDGVFSCPPHFSAELRDFVKQLLVRKPAYRLGQGAGGVGDIKRHAWFAGFDWQAFEAKKLKAPYMPVVKSPGDASNFNAAVDDNAAGGAYRSRPYVSKGDFKEF
ncbi:hypothetical protein OEZ85_003698 [Tetradesmus obliquus]|uniref:cGMP-dependent protein kinase n=1 Tax=Tetradesmus obliquus TaxID=3088 RepID=A0ABY8UHD4_TETOB|nr:hypothetical protein OEZ85_003698 [Tetradesmus obliquus]